MSTVQEIAIPQSRASWLAPFDAAAYLQERRQQLDFTMVEIGHGSYPVAFQQPEFRGDWQYYGVEAWLEHPDPLERWEKQLGRRALQHGEASIEFITAAPGGYRPGPARPVTAEYVGDYDPAIELPDECADEVFLGNVFGAPYIAAAADRIGRLLDEISRLLAPGGMAVIRETNSPELSDVSGAAIAESGLAVADKLWPITTAPETWAALEAVYKADNCRRRTDDIDRLGTNFYLFLAKPALA